MKNTPTWATKQVPEKECVALVAWLDNEITRMQRVRSWVAGTYMKTPLVTTQPGYNPTFTMNDALDSLLYRRRESDKALVALLKKITITMENAAFDAQKAAAKGKP